MTRSKYILPPTRPPRSRGPILAIAGVAVAGVIALLLLRGGGDDDDDADAPPGEPAAAVTPRAPIDPGGGAAPAAAPDAGPPAATAPPRGEGGKPVARKVMVIGASSIQLALGVALEAELEARGVTVHRFGRAATGLTQPETLDWFAKLDQLFGEFAADTVIVNFGGNDALGIEVRPKEWVKWGTPEWAEVYGGRIADLVGKIRARGATAIIIGMPIMKSPKFSAKMKELNQITKTYTERAGGVYLDQWALSATDAGGYRDKVELDGKSRPMRESDGIHYSRWGGQYVARALVERLANDVLDLQGGGDPTAAAGAGGVSERKSYQSAALGKRQDYVVWRPATLKEGATYPVLVLLHGSEASPDAFVTQVNDTLAALAARHELILVAPDGGGSGWWLDSPVKKDSAYQAAIGDELFTALAAELPVGEARGVAGYSMGGHGALLFALQRPGMYRSVSSLSGAVDLTQAGTRAALKARLGTLEGARAAWEAHSVLQVAERRADRLGGVAVRFGCGAKDSWIDANRALHAALDRLGVAHEFHEGKGAHDWAYWAMELPRDIAWHAGKLGGRP